MRILSNLSVSGLLGLNSVADANTDTDKFLVLDSSGIVRYRTGAEVFSDIGAGGAAAYTSVLQHTVKAGVALTKGQAVYVSSADGTNMIVSKASNASEITSSKTLGLIAQNLALNDQGFVVTEGLLAGLDTSTALAGDPVWLGTDGNLLYGIANKPHAPNHMVFIGIVTRVQQNNGEIFVKVQNGFELDELHNVQITSTPADNTVLAYETSTSLYKMKSIPTLLGYTPVTNARNITINGTTYDLSADRSWSVGTTTGSGSAGQVAYWNGSSTQTGSNEFYWDASNNRLGLGTTNPQRKLEIYSSTADNHLRISGPAPSVSLGEAVTGSIYQAKFGLATSNGHYSSSAAAGDFVIISQTGSTIWMTGTTDRLKLFYGGNFVVGGGSDSSLAKLQVVGAIQQSSVLSSVLKVDANGVLVAATAGSDFVAPATLSSYVPTSRTITINGVSYDLSADRSWSISTSSMVYPGAGIAVSTGSSWGTSITDNSSNWNAAYSWGNHSSAGYLTASSASSIYLTISNASSTYLSQSGANTIYLNKNDASNIYLSQSSANTIYLNKTDASNIYLSQSSASSIYLSIGNASTIYLSQSSAASIYASLSGSYSNPSWITSLAWSKITGAPAFITGYTETDTLASVTARGASTTAGINVNGRLTAAGGGTYAVTGSSTQRYIMQALNTANSVNAAYGWWWFHNANGDMGFHADAVGDILTLTRGGGASVNGNTVLHSGNYSSTLDSRYLYGTTSPNNSGNFTISIGNNGSYSYVQSHSGQPLRLNPVGNTIYLDATTYAGAIYASILYDANDSTYYVDPNSTSRLDTLWIRGANSYDGRIYIGGASVGNGLIMNYDQIWTGSGNLHLQYSGSGNIDMNYGGGYTFSRTSLRAPIFYDYDDTGYYADFNSTSDSAIRLRGGILMGPNPTWGAYLQVGGNGNNTDYATVVATDGNLHMDSAVGKAMYLNYYHNGTIWLNGVTYSISSNGSYYNGKSELVTINYNNDSNSNYQLLWGSGNSVYGTAQVYVNPSSDVIYARGGYISPGNAWGTGDSAFFPNGITTAGGTNWVYGLTYLGNAPANGSGAQVESNGRIYVRANSAAASHGFSGLFVDRNSASSNFIPWSFENEYGNHSWGIVARYRISQSGADRPSIQFSSASSDNRWNIGYNTGSDDNFRITQNMGYRNDNSTSDGWGTERFRINTDGNTYAAIGGTLFANGAQVITTSNIGSQSVSYASGAGNSDTVDGYHADAFFRNIGFEGGGSNANSLPESRSAFTYANGAPWSGPIAHLGASGYGLQLNAVYGGDGYAISYRTRNGDNGTWNSWREFIHAGNIGSQTVSKLNPLSGDGNYKLAYTADGARNNAGEWGRAVMYYVPNGQTYGIRVDRADYADSSGSANSVAWTNVSGRPTTTSAFTNDSGYITSGSNVVGLYGSGFGNGNFTWNQTPGGMQQYTGSWASFLISNHGDGATYYNQTIIMPFWGVPQYMRKEGYVNVGPWTFWTTENLNPNSISGNFYASGSITAGGDVTAYSDARVKTNVITVDNALSKVLSLRGVYYNRTDSDDKKRKIGVIAQETLTVVPEVVSGSEDSTYSVSYGNLGGLFIEAFKEQQKKIEAQDKVIEELKSIISGITK